MKFCNMIMWVQKIHSNINGHKDINMLQDLQLDTQIFLKKKTDVFYEGLELITLSVKKKW